jgi:hypothetical protein
LALQRHRASAWRWILALGSGIVLGVFLVSGLIWLELGSSLLNAVLGKRSVMVSEPVVIKQIQQLSRLETVVYTLEDVVEGQHDYTDLLPEFLTGDRILLIGYGQVIAGLDLEKFGSSNVRIRGRTVALQLPPPEILSIKVDNQKTRVYSRETGLLVPADPDLETKVRQEAERKLRESAIKDGILQTATQNARVTLRSFLGGLGFDQIDVQ